MGAAQLAGFLGVSALVIVTPGQDTALTVRNTLLGGRRDGVATAAGVVSGQLVWAAAASAGLSAVLLASAPVFTAIRLAGADRLKLRDVRVHGRPTRRLESGSTGLPFTSRHQLERCRTSS